MSKSILLIGGSGFLGTRLRLALERAEGCTVTVAGLQERQEQNYRTIDILRPEDLRNLDRFDVVVNLTGQVTTPPSLGERMNDEGIRNLIDALRSSSGMMVQISSTSVYGSAERVSELSPLHPDSPYGKCKAHAEKLLEEAISPKRLLRIRLCNLYGPGQSKGLPWYLVDTVRAGRAVTIGDNNGELRRHFLHVEDAAYLIAALMMREVTGIVNVVGDEQYSIRELVALAGSIIGREVVATYGTGRPIGNIGHIAHDRLDELIPMKPKQTLPQYLRAALL